MLLRSASTPILGSLLPPSPHTNSAAETLADPIELPAAAASATTPDTSRSLSLRRSSSHCSLASPGLSASISSSSEAASPTLTSVEDALGWNADADAALGQVRRAQSETDLHKLSSSASAALSAATCLVSREEEKECNGKKGKPDLPLANRRRQRSLSSIPSMCFGASGLDRQDFIPEEIEGSDMSSRGSADNGSPEYSFGNHQISVSKGVKVLEVIDGEVGVIERGGEAGGANSVCCSYGQEKIGHYLTNRRVNQESIMSQVMEREYSAQESKGLGGAKPALEYGGVGADGGGQSGGGGGRRSIALLGNGGGGGGRGGADSDSTDVYYQTMLKENPGHPLFLRNYAQYLAESKRDYPKAEEYYQRAILANPGDGELLGQFAKILWDVHRDKDRAASYFERAVQAAPDDSYVMAAYASFLWNSEDDEESEEEGPANPFSSFPALVSAGQA